MRREEEIRELLINNAIHLIAEGGFERATTKELTHYSKDTSDIKMNEVYIYRLFGSKENLYEAAFIRLDNELYDAFRHGSEMVGGFYKIDKEKLYEFFLLAWRFVLRNEVRCRCYIRYYYSIYFSERSKAGHRHLFRGIIEDLRPFFKDEADVDAILHSVFIALFNFAIRVYNGELEDNEENRPHVFNVLYCMMMTYFNDAAN